MKSVLLSTRPKWCEKICHEIGTDKKGKPIYEKSIEVRKTAPKETPFKVYIYETKESKRRYLDDRFNSFFSGKSCYTDMGKVIGEFICDKVAEYTFSHYEAEYRVTHVEQKAMCLNQPELIRYGKGKPLYGWHISQLKIYDKPKELSKFRKPLDSVYCSSYRDYCEEGCVGFGSTDYICNDYWNWEKGLTRPPQSWCYVQEEDALDVF